MLESVWKKILRRRRFSLWHLAALPLWMASVPYRFLPRLQRRLTKDRVRIDIPIISVGNITVGGTGKTPIVEMLARRFVEEGFRVGIVSSGWGRESEEPYLEPGYRLQERTAEEVGDEVLLLATLVPEAVFSIDLVKAEAARRLAESEYEVDLVIIDDAFQHYQLERDLDIVTYDAAIKAHVLKPFPYGVMREPRSALKRADVVIITRSNFARDIGKLRKRLRRITRRAELYAAQFNVQELVGHERRWPVKYLEDKSVLLFAGVGNFEPLRRQVSVLAGDLDEALEFNDHQEYDEETLGQIKAVADRHDSDVIVTTGKDWVKIRHFDFGREIYYLAQAIDLDPGEEQLVIQVQNKLGLQKVTD